ncbi:MAG: hypothetical protein M1838_002007 [Thelocarpon superellum]|nr:MAG: hypothetical protein M1838_002007 [Thelocarpon superellum]
MSALQELDAALQPMLLLKPPGVSGSKIKEITALCIANVKSESVIIQKIYTHFKKAPGTHKLGVLYVVDSVTRQWVDHARKSGQTVGTAAGDGTYAAGVNRVTELLPVLMTDLIQQAPEDQKEKIKKLVDIWERGSTFPAPLLASFKEKLNAAPNVSSTTPTGTPPQEQLSAPGPAPSNGSTAGAPNTSAILAALANIAKQNTAPPPTTSNAPAQENGFHVSNAQNAFPQPVSSSVNPSHAFPPTAHSVDVPGGGPSIAPPFSGLNLNGMAAPAANAPPNPLGALASMMPQVNAGGAEALQQQLMLIQVLMQQGIPQDQWAPILATLGAGGMNPGLQNAWSGRGDAPSRDRNGPPPASGHIQSPPNRPTYGEYHGDSPGRNGNRGDGFDRNRGRGGRGRGGNEYRQRSPPPNRRNRSPDGPGRHGPAVGGPKFLEFDYSIGKDNIKAELRSVFSQFGTVQTCIVNQDKRHGFIKMISRGDALAAKDGMEHYKPPDMQLRTRWGVGFGPRDCSDYQTGISVIPIGRLTDADRKWMLTAEYGGSGGKPIEGGMVVEEPDIEIGAGVSSKAISRRMATDQGGKTGPRSTRGGPEPGGSRFRRHDRPDQGSGHNSGPGPGPGPGPGHGLDRDSNGAVGVPPAVPGFGFQFPGFPNGMPMMPAGFVFPGNGGQPPSSSGPS